MRSISTAANGFTISKQDLAPPEISDSEVSDSLLLHPREQALPALVGRLLAILRPVVGEERVAGVRKDVNLGMARGRVAARERLLHLVERRHRDRLVLGAVEPQHWRLERRRDVDGML